VSIFDVRHQDRAHRILQLALASRRMPHAYLFTGPEGVGREMLAVRLAHVLLCASPAEVDWPDEMERTAAANVRPRVACGRCDDCRLLAADTHPDLYLIHRQLNRQHPDALVRRQKALFLGVEVIRHFLIDRIATKPARGRAKVFIVREAERLNDAAQNALLKSLEEPPPDTTLILVTTSLDKMLPTTRSRCQLVPFVALPASFVTAELARLRPEARSDEVRYAAHHADGSLGRALRYVDDELFELKRGWGEQLAVLARPPAGWSAHALAGPFRDDADRLAKTFAQRDPDVSDTDARREGVRMLLAVLADFFRDALATASSAPSEQVNADQAEVVAALARGGRGRLADTVKHLVEAESCLDRNAHVELTLETLFIRLARCLGRPTGQPVAP